MPDFMKVVMEQMKIHMTGTMTNTMSVDLRLWMEDRLFAPV